MPKAAASASRTHRGGRGPRYRVPASTTPTGRRPSSPRLTAAAAVLFSQQLHALSESQGLSLVECIIPAISSDQGRQTFLSQSLLARAGAELRGLLSAFLEDKAAKLLAKPGTATAIAIGIRERVRAHAGPPRRIADAPPEPEPMPMTPGAWLGAGPLSRRQPPLQASRIEAGIRSWNLARLGPIPSHSIVCYERAAGRVSEWRARTGAAASAPPPLSLLRAIVYTSVAPTAVAAKSDHYYLPVLRRWASPSEVLALFDVPRAHPLYSVLNLPDVLPIAAVSMLGRAIHVGAASHAIRTALGSLPPSPVRYASACSGIDLAAVAMGSIMGDDWEYIFASESDPQVARTLARAHAHAGLLPSRIFPDATAPEATGFAPPVDVWLISPPCQSYSRRNHDRSHTEDVDAVTAFDLMLEYPRVHRPTCVVVENVDEPASRALITAAVLSLHGYTWQQFVSDASRYGGMARARRFWVGRVPSVVV